MLRSMTVSAATWIADLASEELLGPSGRQLRRERYVTERLLLPWHGGDAERCGSDAEADRPSRSSPSSANAPGGKQPLGEGLYSL